jgi:predicted ribosomally synthesized peptide with nif11-like leader
MSDFLRLLQDLSITPGLQARLEQVGSAEAAVAAAGEAGYRITEDEVAAYLAGLAQQSHNALSDTQLDAVSGGKSQQGDGPLVAAWRVVHDGSPRVETTIPANGKGPLPSGVFILK